MRTLSPLPPILFLAIYSLSPVAIARSANTVTIKANFPGANIRVVGKKANMVHLAPDWRGDNPWFYWYFEAIAKKPGPVHFSFPEKVIGFKNGAIGPQGPAVSTDLGNTWKWMGTKNVKGSIFRFNFTRSNQRVRFAVTIPYLQSDLDQFLKKNASNPYLQKRTLTKSRKGRIVELLQIGKLRTSVKPVIVTGRHHASETIASFVLEGFLQEAISDSPAAREFRKKYALYAIPFVDKDGVEEGDQGKNRKPYDHNRDYRSKSIYPEIRAIKELDRTMNFRFSLDFHCPTLVMPDHQVMYFVGPKNHPPNNYKNVSAFAGQIKKNLPRNAPVGPLVWLKNASEPAPMNSHYFGFKKDAIMAATIEIPFAPKGKNTEPDSCRAYGKAFLHAWVKTRFHPPTKTN